MDKAYNNAKVTFYSNRDREPFSIKNMLVLPYHKNFKELPSLLKYFNINIVFSNPNTIEKMLIKNSPSQASCCLYTIPCKDCDKKYLGQTSKGLKTRLGQHKYSVRTAQSSNAIFIHFSHFNHRVDWANGKEIMFCNDYVSRNVIESALIKTYSANLMNLSPGMYKLDNLIIEKIVKNSKICI